jgi:predicted lipid-binding transport protein (Tim44 family)
MKRWQKYLGTAWLTLLIFACQASLVWARAGGGVGGSVGRSFSSGGGSLGRSFSGGSFSFFPFFFLGGSSFGGGIFSLLFLGIICYLIYKAWKATRHWRHNGSNSFNNPYQDLRGNPGNVPIDLNGRKITNAANLQRFGKAISFTRENMQYFAQTFPRWDRDFLLGRVRQVFFWIQDAWSRQDFSQAMDYLAPVLAAKYNADIEAMKARGERNVIKDPVLNPEDLEFIHSNLEEGNEHVIVMIYASLVDYTVDSSGRQISGDSQNRLFFTEFWELYWQTDKWVLSKIMQEDALELANIARGEI